MKESARQDAIMFSSCPWSTGQEVLTKRILKKYVNRADSEALQ